MLRKLVVFCAFTAVIADFNVSDEDVHTRFTYKFNEMTEKVLYRGALTTFGDIYATALYPLFVVAAILGLFAEGKLYYIILKFLNLKSRVEIRKLFSDIRENSPKGVPVGTSTLTLKAYTDKDNRFCEAFSYEYNKLFGGETRVLDYNKPKEAANEINKQVKSEDSRFKSVISSRMIEKGSKNGLHFISTFELTQKYDKIFRFTREKTIKFKSGNKVTMLPGMTGKGIVKFAEIKSLDAKTIELKGEGTKYAYLIVYPNKPDGLLKIIDKLRNPAIFEEIIEKGKEVCAKVSIIKRDYVTTIDLKRTAEELNYLKGFFEEGGLQLRGATQKCERTFISSILHQIRLKPTPIQTEYNDNICSSYPIELETDRPHLYYVMFKRKTEPKRSPVVGVVVDITTKFD